MNRFRRAMQNFMQGRNGMDEFGTAFLATGVLFYFLHFLTGESLLNTISTVFLIYAMFRMLSKNLYARSSENRAFLARTEYLRMKWTYRKTHKIYLCKGCGKMVRVPRGKGKIEVTCPVCGRTKILKS